jgi:hypothetical protein
VEDILNEKDATTALVGVTTSRKKLLLYLTANGPTSRVEAAQLNRIQDTKLTIPYRDGHQSQRF